ncbi:MAG: YeeE/YedE family protein [Rhodospirillaceae bacterium]
MAWQLPLLGGLLIGAGAVVLMIGAGRIAGISGILGGLLPPDVGAGWGWRLAFLAGLVAGPLAAGLWLGGDAVVPPRASLALLALAGLLVGAGTALGRGCTSGHGVCGLARLSPRSAAATGVFMAVAMVTVFLVRHGW